VSNDNKNAVPAKGTYFLRIEYAPLDRSAYSRAEVIVFNEQELQLQAANRRIRAKLDDVFKQSPDAQIVSIELTKGN